MLKAARYASMNLLVLVMIAALLVGGPWGWVVYVVTALLTTVGDEHAGDDTATLGGRAAWFYDLNLYLTLPLVALMVLLAVGHVAPAGSPFFAGLWSVFGADHAVALAATGSWSLAGLIVAAGLFVGAAAVNVAHELMHRTGNLRAWLSSRWLLAFSLDTTFAIEHIHGHHRYVCTDRDPATARRGEYVLAFVIRSTVGQFVNAFRHEAARLARRGLPVWSHHNVALRGQVMSVVLIALAWLAAGWAGIGVFLLLAAQGKLYLELVNYVEHYGLVREPGGRVEPRHAWNCYHIISNAVLYNLPRHSHHHMFAAKPFWALEADSDAPLLPYGYKTMIVMALVPPLWRRVVEPRLAEWDTRFASEGERRLLAEAGFAPALRAAE
jgi:alkane 1-monooxygenase